MKNSLSRVVKWVIISLIFLMIVGLKLSFGQFSLGAAYYQRNEKPQNGFSFRMENDVKLTPKLFRLGIQAHFDYYSDKSKLGSRGISMGKVNNYTVGLVALAKIKLLIIEPYVGLGIGFDKVNQSISGNVYDLPGSGGSDTSNKQKTIYQGVVGSEATLLSFLHPFVEYRTHAPSLGEVLKKPSKANTSGVWAFGVLLKF